MQNLVSGNLQRNFRFSYFREVGRALVIWLVRAMMTLMIEEIFIFEVAIINQRSIGTPH